MSNAEVTLGAHLYISAIESDIPHLLKHGGEYAPKEDLEALGNAFRNAAKWMTKNQIVTIDSDHNWKINDEKLSDITDSKNRQFTPYYDTVVRAHKPVLDAIENSGKAEYVKSFNEIHEPFDFEIEPETIALVSDESMQRVAFASLNFLSAVHKDPANAAFIPGLASEDLKKLHGALANANYLMPEDAPADREIALGEQALRGTQEEKDAIFENASALAANVKVPESIQQGDAPMMSVAMLQKYLDGAEFEQFLVENIEDIDAPNPLNSDLMRKDAQMINKVFLAGTHLVNESQYDTEDFDNVLVHREQMDSLREIMEEYNDSNINVVLSRPDFIAPGVSPSSAKQIRKSISFLQKICLYDHEAAQISADEGGSSTESSYEESYDEDLEGDSETTQTDDGIVSDHKAGVSGLTNEDREDVLGHVDPYSKVPRAYIDEWNSLSVSMIADGVDHTLSILAGDEENLTSSLRSGVDRAAFAMPQDATRGGSMGRASVSLYSDTMSYRRHAEMNPTMKSQFTGNRIVKIEPGRGFLKGTNYKSPSSEAAAKRVSIFVQENMVVDGQPNTLLRASLKEMGRKPIVATNAAEAIAWKNEAHSFIERDENEEKLRKEVIEKQKQGLFFADLDEESASKFVNIVSASGSKDPARVSINEEGNVSITHPEGPRISSVIDNPPKELKASGKSGRTFGGMINPDRIRAALESSTNSAGVTLVFSGETPKGVIAKVNEIHTKAREVDKFPDMSLT
jgi:hypothetical protein